MTGRIVIASVLGLGIAGAIPSVSLGQQDRQPWEQRREEDVPRRYSFFDNRLPWQEQYLNFDELPREVRQAVQRLSDPQNVQAAQRIARQEITLYRVLLRDDLGNRIVTLSQDGDVVARAGAADDEWSRLRVNQLPRDARKAVLSQAQPQDIADVRRAFSFDRGEYYVVLLKGERGPRTLHVNDEGEIISNFGPFGDDWRARDLTGRDLPGQVRDALGSAGVDLNRITNAVEVSADDQTYYRVTYGGPSRKVLYTLTRDGRIVESTNITPAGRESIAYDVLPGPVKSTLQKESAGGRIGETWRITRENETFYAARIDEGNDSRTVFLGRQGGLMDESEIPGGPVFLSDRPEQDRQDRDDLFWLPQPVRQEINTLSAEGREIGDIKQVTHDGQRAFEVTVTSPLDNRSWRYVIGQDGKRLVAENLTEAGRQEINWRALPGDVRETLTHFRQQNRIENLYQITRRNETFYLARIRSGNDVRDVYVGRNGAIMTPPAVQERLR